MRVDGGAPARCGHTERVATPLNMVHWGERSKSELPGSLERRDALASEGVVFLECWWGYRGSARQRDPRATMANPKFQLGAASIAAVLALGTAGALTVIAEHGLVVKEFRTDSPSRIPVVEVTSSAGARSQRPVAFLVHGFQCNKSMMVPLAKRLAAQGIDAYAVDLPGHGASLDRFSEVRARDVAREALETIVAARGTPPDRVILVGHSYGANLLARIEGQGARARTRIMLGPSYSGGLSPETAGNLLVLTAEREHPYVITYAREMLEDATGRSLDAAGEATGDASNGDARAWQVVPGTDHVSLVFTEAALERTSSWIARSLRVATIAEGPAASAPLALAIFALAAAVALARGVIAAWPRAAAVEAEAAVRLGGPMYLAVIGFIALAVAVLVGRRFSALAWLRLLEGERIASLLAIAGVSMAALGRGRVSWPRAGQIARGLPTAAIAFVIVYFAAVLAIDTGIYRLSLAKIAPERYSAAFALAVTLSPFFAFSGALLERVRVVRGGGVRGVLWTGVAAVALCAAVSMALYLVDARLGRFGVPFAAVCLFALAAGVIFNRAARNPAVGTIFSAAVTAWVIAVGFARY